MMIVASILALISARGLAAAADGSVLQDCTQVNLFNPGPSDWHLHATCWNNTNDLICSQMNLDSCFTNIDGTIQRSGNGLGLKGCQDCALQGSSLSCQCPDGSGNLKFSAADMNDTVLVSGGLLNCFGLSGPRCSTTDN